MVVVERYPDLKSISGFNDLRAQLEGTENRIAVARKRYIDAVQTYNVTVRSFPTNLTAKMFGHDVKPNFTVENEAQISRPPSGRLRHAATPHSRVEPQLEPVESTGSQIARCAAARDARCGASLLLCAVAALALAQVDSPAAALAGHRSHGHADARADRDARAATARIRERSKGSQIAVLLVPTTQPETIEQYSIRVAEAWKLGRRRRR